MNLLHRYLSIFFLLFILSSQLEAVGVTSTIESLIEAKQYQKAGRLMREKFGKSLKIEDIQALARKMKFQPLAQTASATEWFLSQKAKLGLDANAFLETAFYIETEMKSQVLVNGYYLDKQSTGLDYTIEHDPESAQSFIVLEGKEAFLGLGGKKKVYKSILVSGNKSKVQARGDQIKPMDLELKMTKLLQGAKGIYATGAMTTHKQDDEVHYTLYSDLYQPGSLTRYVFKNYTFSLYEKAKIMHGILTGLESVHSRKLVHRDLHAQNYFLNIIDKGSGKREIEAVIADMGRTIPVEEAIGVVVQGSVKCIAPEGFIVEKMKHEDYYKTDIFASGCVFYRIFHGKMPSWIAKEYFKDLKVSKQEKSEYVKTELNKATETRRATLLSKMAKGKLSSKGELELIILQMVHVDPAKRGTAKELKEKVEKILKKLGRNSG